MKILLYIFPVALLVAYSQIVVKWRIVSAGLQPIEGESWIRRLLEFVFDPYIASAYVAALLGSFVWMFVLAKLPLNLAFPIYYGLIFVLVVAGSALLLGEILTPVKLIAVAMILGGVILGAST